MYPCFMTCTIPKKRRPLHFVSSFSVNRWGNYLALTLGGQWFFLIVNTAPDKMPTKIAFCLMINQPSLEMILVIFASIASAEAIFEFADPPVYLSNL